MFTVFWATYSFSMICEFSGNIFSTVVDVERVGVVVKIITARVMLLMSFTLVWAWVYDEIVVFWAAADDEIDVVLDVVCGSIVVKICVVCASVDEMGVVLDVDCASVDGELDGVCASGNDEMGVIFGVVIASDVDEMGVVFGVVSASDDEMDVVLDVVIVLVELLASVVNPVTDGGWHDSIRNIMAASTTDLDKSILK